MFDWFFVVWDLVLKYPFTMLLIIGVPVMTLLIRKK